MYPTSLMGVTPTINAVWFHIGNEITKSSMLKVVLRALFSPSEKTEIRPSRPKSAIKERVSLAVMEAGFIMLMNLWLRAAMPTPPIPRFQAVPGVWRLPTPYTE